MPILIKSPSSLYESKLLLTLKQHGSYNAKVTTPIPGSGKSRYNSSPPLYLRVPYPRILPTSQLDESVNSKAPERKKCINKWNCAVQGSTVKLICQAEADLS